jgi:DNA-binding transcriptional ArsR family regulator
MFKVLGVETRVKIIGLLRSRGPLGAKGIAELLGITPAAVSQHLKILRQAGLVRNERKGYWIPYSIDEGAGKLCQLLVKSAHAGVEEAAISEKRPEKLKCRIIEEI